MWYSTRPPVAASFAILLALLFFSPVASAGTTSRLACEYARSHLIVFVYLVCLLLSCGGKSFDKFPCMVLGILVAFEWILAGVYWVARIV